jgi:hypothetical protein
MRGDLSFFARANPVEVNSRLKARKNANRTWIACHLFFVITLILS